MSARRLHRAERLPVKANRAAAGGARGTRCGRRVASDGRSFDDAAAITRATGVKIGKRQAGELAQRDAGGWRVGLGVLRRHGVAAWLVGGVVVGGVVVGGVVVGGVVVGGVVVGGVVVGGVVVGGVVVGATVVGATPAGATAVGAAVVGATPAGATVAGAPPVLPDLWDTGSGGWWLAVGVGVASAR